MIAALLALVAAVLLAVGYFADVVGLGWAALAASATAAVLVLLPTFRSAPEIEPDESPEPVETPEPQPDAPDVEPVETRASDPQPDSSDVEPVETRRSEAVTDPDLVLVTPGRHRYHRPGCALIADREVEQLTEDEAREEGFSACTRCVT